MSPWEVDPMAVAVGELDPPERAEADRLLREDPAFRAEVARLGRVTRALAGMPAAAWTSSDPPPPPLDVSAALAARAPGAPPEVPAAPAVAPGGGPSDSPAEDAAPERQGPPRRRGSRVRRGPGVGLRRTPRALVLRPLGAGLAALALLAAGAGGAALAGLGQDAADPRPVTSATRPAPAPERIVPLEPLAPVASGVERARVALPERAGGTVRVAIDGLEPLPEGRFLELWLLGEGDDMVSLGTFRVGSDGRVRVALPLGADPAGARFVDLSVERDDGDPTHSGRSLLRSNALS